MSRLSIFDTAWTDLVFEGRNQEYGAYQLRKEHPQTTLKAMLIVLLMISALVAVPLIATLFNGSAPPIPQIYIGPTVLLENVEFPKIQPPVKEDVIAPPLKSDEPTTQKSLKKHDIVTPAHGENPDNISAPVGPEVTGETGNPSGTRSGTEGSPGGIPSGTGPEAGPASPEGPVRMEILDKRPIYLGGYDVFKNEIAKKFNTPEDEFEPGTLVTVELTFVIEKDGSMTNIKVVRSSGKSLDQEALRVLKSMKKKWEPGFYQGKPVSVIFKQAIKLRVH